MMVSPRYIPLIIVLIIWTFFWKGLATWHAASRKEKAWFFLLLIINTFGILELIYLFFVVKVKNVRFE